MPPPGLLFLVVVVVYCCFFVFGFFFVGGGCLKALKENGSIIWDMSRPRDLTDVIS